MKEVRKYYEDRNQDKINENKLIDKETYTWNKEKIIIIALDGLEFNNVKKLLNIDKWNYKKYKTQNHESIKGWTSILYGNINGDGLNIFDICKNNKIYTALTCNWNGLETKVIKNKKNISYYKNYDIKENYTKVTEDSNINELLEKINVNYENANKLILEQKYGLIMYYDVFADEAGHGWNDYNSNIVIKVFKLYKIIINNLIKLAEKYNYKFLITTDHGRNADGMQHEREFLENRKSWCITNIVDLPINMEIYDIKKIIINSLRD